MNVNISQANSEKNKIKNFLNLPTVTFLESSLYVKIGKSILCLHKKTSLVLDSDNFKLVFNLCTALENVGDNFSLCITILCIEIRRLHQEGTPHLPHKDYLSYGLHLTQFPKFPLGGATTVLNSRDGSLVNRCPVSV